MNKNEKEYEREERERTGDNTRAGADGFVWYKFKVINRFESHPFSALYTLWDWINLAQNITHFWMFTLFVNSRLIAFLKFWGGGVFKANSLVCLHKPESGKRSTQLLPATCGPRGYRQNTTNHVSNHGDMKSSCTEHSSSFERSHHHPYNLSLTLTLSSFTLLGCLWLISTRIQ